MLAKVKIAANISEALACRADLHSDETVVTPDGVWCGRHWLRLARGGSDDGVLAREREIRLLEATLDEDGAALEQQGLFALEQCGVEVAGDRELARGRLQLKTYIRHG